MKKWITTMGLRPEVLFIIGIAFNAEELAAAVKPAMSRERSVVRRMASTALSATPPIRGAASTALPGMVLPVAADKPATLKGAPPARKMPSVTTAARPPMPKGTVTAMYRSLPMAIKAADELAELLAKPYEDYAAWKANPTRLKPIWPVIQEVLKNWENRINSYDRIHLTAAYKIYALSKAIAIVIEKRFDVLLGDSPLKKLNGLQIKGYKESIEEAQEAVKQAIKNGKAVMDREETRIFRELLSTFQTQCWKTGIRKTKRTFLDSDLDLTLNNFWDTAQGIWRDPPPPSASWCYSPNDFQDIEQEVWLDDAAQEIGSYPLLPSLHHGQWW